MLRIGLTGGIGSGKSTVADMFARRGAPVIDTDAIARELTTPGAPGYVAVVQAFGEEMLDDAGNIDRAQLRERVFRDARARGRLEAILHPRIRTEVEHRMARLNAAYCVVVVPLLIETDFAELVDRILVVDADEEQQIARVATRRGLARAEVQKILATQSDRARRRARADDVLVNNADLGALDIQVDALDKRYRALAAAR